MTVTSDHAAEVVEAGETGVLDGSSKSDQTYEEVVSSATGMLELPVGFTGSVEVAVGVQVASDQV